MEAYKEELPYAYWLHNIKGVGNKGIRRLLAKGSKPSRLYFMEKKQMLQLYVETESIFKEETVYHIIRTREEWDIKKEYDKMKRKGIDFYPAFHPLYPNSLRELPDAPWALYVIGQLPKQDRPVVAVIGARECSAYGAHVAKELGKALAERGIQVVSGMARGIDSIAQQSALKEGEAYGVLGSGVDICYPLGSRNVYEDMKRKGGIISEYPPGTEPKACNFPARNRIISGLSQAVVVVEAKEKSGTLITVDMALEQGRDVYVVPGRVTDALSAGCNRLIKQGADVLCSVEEFIKEVCGKSIYPIGDVDFEEKEGSRKGQLQTLEQMILESMDYYPKTIQAIHDGIKKEAENGKPPELKKLMEILVKLEKEGFIQVRGGYYALKS